MEYTGIEPNGRQAVNRAAAQAWRGSGGLEGEPDHRDYVLSDEERESGKLMTICCSRSKTPSLTLDL